ncbi:MAG: hypothetical protein K2Y22_04035 [Candidatus Obscuribacterales bacterium]|nr:hypothetical protein [Candidatus Obscuribacterales bacterium]
MKLVGYVCGYAGLPTTKEQEEQIKEFCKLQNHVLEEVIEGSSPTDFANLNAAISTADKLDGLVVYSYSHSLGQITKPIDIKATLERFVQQIRPKSFFAADGKSDLSTVQADYKSAKAKIDVEIAKRGD